MSSAHIYPYVYKGIHPSTGEFYIGLRYANKCIAEEDLGTHYKTSSKIVKPRFHEFEWTVLAVFFNKEDAYDYEQQLIVECIDDPLILNQSYYHSGERFISAPHSPDHFTDAGLKRLREIKLGTKVSDETRLKMSQAQQERWNRYGNRQDDIVCQKISDSLRGIPKSQDTRDRMSASAKKRVMSPETRAKISEAMKRKKSVQP